MPWCREVFFCYAVVMMIMQRRNTKTFGILLGRVLVMIAYAIHAAWMHDWRLTAHCSNSHLKLCKSSTSLSIDGISTRATWNSTTRYLRARTVLHRGLNWQYIEPQCNLLLIVRKSFGSCTMSRLQGNQCYSKLNYSKRDACMHEWVAAAVYGHRSMWRTI